MNADDGRRRIQRWTTRQCNADCGKRQVQQSMTIDNSNRKKGRRCDKSKKIQQRQQCGNGGQTSEEFEPQCCRIGKSGTSAMACMQALSSAAAGREALGIRRMVLAGLAAVLSSACRGSKARAGSSFSYGGGSAPKLQNRRPHRGFRPKPQLYDAARGGSASGRRRAGVECAAVVRPARVSIYAFI